MKTYLAGAVILFSLAIMPAFASTQTTLTVDIKADDSNGPITIPYGTASMLSWTSSGASFCSGSRSGSGTWGGTLATSGTQGTGNLTGASTFTISCQSSNGTVVTDSVTVNVSNPSPTVDLKADHSNGPITIPYGTASMLSWSSTNTSFCSGSRSGSSGTWGGTLPTSGAQGTGNLTSSNTFTLSCQSPSGVVVTDSVTVNVASTTQAPTVNLIAGSTTHTGVYNEMLDWSSANADSCTASGAWSGSKSTSGAQSVGPITATSVYTLTCTGQGGTASKSVTITVVGTSTPQHSIKVITPNGGETLTLGSTYEVKNTYDNQIQPMIGYALYKGSTKLGYLAGTPIISDQNFKWNVGQYQEFNSNEVKTATPGSDYKIGLYTPGNSQLDFSDGPFTIIPSAPTSQLAITFPSQGSSLEIGKKYEIRWTGYGSNINSYSVYLVGGSLGSTGSIYLGQTYASAGRFAWTVPNTVSVGSNYQIKLSGTGGTGANSQSFNIVNPTREVADIDTQPQSSSCLDLSNDLRYRSRDAQTNGEVSDLQDFLQTNGYLKSEPTGYFGFLTLQAAKDFQRANNISPTGFVGPITRAKIKALSCQ